MANQAGNAQAGVSLTGDARKIYLLDLPSLTGEREGNVG